MVLLPVRGPPGLLLSPDTWIRRRPSMVTTRSVWLHDYGEKLTNLTVNGASFVAKNASALRSASASAHAWNLFVPATAPSVASP
jgi:hypothetical protein